MTASLFSPGRVSVFSRMILLLLLASPATLVSQETLTNASVVQMVEAHLSADVIVAQIENNPGHYVLTTNSLIQLKQAGVPDRVFAAMQAKARGSGGSAPAGSSKPRTEDEPATSESRSTKGGAWHQLEITDPMSDERTTFVGTTVPGDPAGKFEVRVACEDDGEIEFAFINRSRGLTLKRTPMGQTVTGTVTGFGGQATEHGVVSAPRSCVMMDIRVGDAAVQSHASDICADDYETAAIFIGDPSRAIQQKVDLLGQLMKSASPDQRGVALTNDITPMLGNWIAKMSAKTYAAAQDAGLIIRMNQVLAANSMRVQFPFTDDSSSVIRLDLADPEFRKYTSSRCIAPGTHPAMPVGEALASGEPGRPFTVDDFATVLSELLKIAAKSHRQLPDAYDKDADYLGRVLERCSSYTGGLRFSPLGSLGPAFADCNQADAIDISREAGDVHGPSGGADLLLKLSYTRDPRYFNNGGPIITLGIGDFNTPLVKEADIQPTDDAKNPQIWEAENGPDRDGGLRVPIVWNYRAGPTWVVQGGKIRVMFNVADAGAPPNSVLRAELLRAPDVKGQPGNWATADTKTMTMNPNGASFMFWETAEEPGRYWYGMRLADAANRVVREPQPLLVRVASADEIAKTTADGPEGLFPGGTEVVLGTPADPPPSSQKAAVAPPVSSPAPLSSGTGGGANAVSGMVTPANAAPLLPSAAGLATLVRLTPRTPVSVVMRQTAAVPGPNLHYYRVLSIDTRDFHQGGVLVIDVQVPANGMASGNFDLFPADVPIPKQGPARGIVASQDNVAPGTSGQIVYHFAAGQLFNLGIEGTRSRQGASSFVQFQASVRTQ